jgi:thiol-disulfide isomerase/thioredoxin
VKRHATWLILGGVALLAAAIGYKIGFIDKTKEAPPGVTASAAAIMALPLTDLAGQPQRLEQWRGRILVLNYWATWCAPCRDEMPGFSRLHEKYQSKGIQFVGISIDDADKIIEFQKQTPVSYPLLIGDMNTMAKSAEIGNSRQALPFTAVFDRQGNLAMSKLGRWSEADLEPKLNELISR